MHAKNFFAASLLAFNVFATPASIYTAAAPYAGSLAFCSSAACAAAGQCSCKMVPASGICAATGREVEVYLPKSTVGGPMRVHPRDSRVERAPRLVRETVDSDGTVHKTLADGSTIRIPSRRLESYVKDPSLPIDAPIESGFARLHRAIIIGDQAAVEQLLKAGANVNIKSKNSYTPLHLAVQYAETYPESPTILRLILDHKDLDTTQQNFEGNTALHIIMIRAGRLDCSKDAEALKVFKQLLARKNVNVNQQNSDGETVLHIAADYGKLHFITALLEAGADATLKNIDGKTPADCIKDDAVRALLK